MSFGNQPSADNNKKPDAINYALKRLVFGQFLSDFGPVKLRMAPTDPILALSQNQVSENTQKDWFLLHDNRRNTLDCYLFLLRVAR